MGLPKNKLSALILPLLFMSLSFSAFPQPKDAGVLAEKLLALTPETIWEKVDSIPLKLDAYQTQGMVRIGEHFSMLNNPCAVESTDHGLRAYFVPDDNHAAVLYLYDLR